jgi:hypothetical protein
MKYEIFGGFEIPRKPNKKSVVDTRDRYDFWWSIEDTKPGLCHARGCYIFALRKRGGDIVPYYVGKTIRQGFYKECFSHHKLVYYNEVITSQQATPLLYLIARTTPGGKFTASFPENESEFLESMLIGRALQRNEDLKNRTHATFLKKLHVPGLVNPRKGHKSEALRGFTSMLKA